MNGAKARVLRPGHRIALDQDVYTVIQLNGTTVTLQDQHGELSAMLLGYLLAAPGFAALDAAPRRRAPQDGRLSILDEAEQQRIRWLEGHLIELETGRHPEGPVRELYAPDLHSMDERELAKMAELRAEGPEISQRSLQRLRQAYRDNGLIGLADKRALRSQTPGAAVDPRVVDAVEEMLADPRGRSTVARSAMFTQLQRMLDEVHGSSEVPMPSRATFYRLMSHYTGRDTTRRGPDLAEDAVWTVAQLQELFDEWVVACWQNRPHEGLSHTWGEGRGLSPNEMFAACVGISGYVPLPLTGDDYIELLPTVFRTVNDYGLTLDNRTYDCKALNPYRRLDSGLRGGNKQWEVHYDITLIWLRDHRSDEWITVPWVYRSLAGQPFGLALWEHARPVSTERSGPRPAEADVARNVADLLKRASGSNLSPEEAKVVAVEANRPAHPKPEESEAAVLELETNEGLEPTGPGTTADPSSYEVFDPDGTQWRL